MNYYKITADTCQEPKVVFTQTGMTFEKARYTATTLSGGFRNVRVVNELTGEVVFSIYSSPGFFSPACAVAEALKKIGV